MRVRNFVLDTIRSVFESFGFEPLETPSLEYASTLLGKYGKEADRLVYTFKDRGGREVGLIYDLTVPVSRVLAIYGKKIPLPFKRYQIQRVWRAEKPQKGRFREFVQCDFDIFGVDSPLADAEIIAVIYQVLKKLNFNDFKIRINSRPLLFSVLEESGITGKNQQLEVLRTIDKLGKVPQQKLIEELKKKGLVNLTNDRLFNKIQVTRPNEEITKILNYLQAMGLEEKYYCFDPTLVRGLDYYTGPIFEAVIGDSSNSVAGGGRYDNLIEQLGGPPIPATGASLGLDRLCELVKEKNFLKENLKPAADALVTVFPTSQVSNVGLTPPSTCEVEKLEAEALKLVAEVRAANINTEIYLGPAAKLDKQIKYADRKGVPYVLILGPEEAKSNTVTIKSLKTGEQEAVRRDQITTKLKIQN